MSELRKSKRALEQQIGPIRFKRASPPRHVAVECHGVIVGSGMSFLEAVDDAADNVQLMAMAHPAAASNR